MEYSQKYTLVAFLEPVRVNSQFAMTDWPIHMTLADVFAVELDEEIGQELSNLLRQRLPIKLSVGKDAILGTTKVALINKSNELQNLHDKIIDVLESHGAKFNTPEFTRKGFLPHSTIQRSGRVQAGEKFEINSISLVDMFPGGDWQQRKIIRSFNSIQA